MEEEIGQRQVHHQQPCNDFEEVLLMGGEPVDTGHSGLDGEGTGFRWCVIVEASMSHWWVNIC